MTTDIPIVLRVSPQDFIEISGIERYGDGSGYTSRLSVSSGRFSCSDHAFYFDNFERFAKNLATAYERVEGKAHLGHTFETDFFEIQVFRGGRVSVSGVIIQHGPPRQELRFGFRCDQTFLPDVLRSLSEAGRDLDVCA
jgi:hypothetical protein